MLYVSIVRRKKEWRGGGRGGRGSIGVKVMRNGWQVNLGLLVLAVIGFFPLVVALRLLLHLDRSVRAAV
jgi:hypothetical protein